MKDDFTMHKWLIQKDNINHFFKNGVTFYTIENVETGAKRKTSPLQSKNQTPSKRSRSAPNNDAEDKKDEKQGHYIRQSRSVRFQATPTTSGNNNRGFNGQRNILSSRTRSENRHQLIVRKKYEKFIQFNYFKLI